MGRIVTAEEHKAEGNALFNEGNFVDAVACYTKAIIKAPETARYYTNRALCYIKLAKWDSAVADCRRAVELEPRSIKGVYFLGKALTETGAVSEALKYLKAAKALAASEHCLEAYAEDIQLTLRRAQKLDWERKEQVRLRKTLELQDYLCRLLEEKRDRDIAEMQLRRTDGGKVSTDAAAQATRDEAETRLSEVRALVAAAETNLQPRDVPDYLCCKISYEIMRDPVITPSGITYDRKSIACHLRQAGATDPFTRAPLAESDLVPNLAIKEAVDAFLADNGWAAEL